MGNLHRVPAIDKIKPILVTVDETVAYLAGTSWIGSWIKLAVSVEKRVGREATHRREELKEQQKKVTGKYYQEIRGSSFNDVVENG